MGSNNAKEQLDEAALRVLMTSQASDTLSGPSRRQTVDQQTRDTKVLAGRADREARRAESRFANILQSSNFCSPAQSGFSLSSDEKAMDQWWQDSLENYEHPYLAPKHLRIPGTNLGIVILGNVSNVCLIRTPELFLIV